MTDLRVLRAELSDTMSNVAIYTIDAIDFDLLIPETVPRSNRERCLILSEHLANCESDISAAVRCLIDADSDYFHNRRHDNAIIVSTDFSDLLCHFLNVKTLKYLLQHQVPDIDAEGLIATIINVCERIFQIRQATAQIDQSLGVPDTIFRSLTVDFGNKRVSIGLDEQRCLEVILGNSGRHDLRESLKFAMQNIRRRDDLSPLQQIRGHDFAHVFKQVLIARQGRYGNALSREAVEAMLLGCQAGAGLSESGFFRLLVSNHAK